MRIGKVSENVLKRSVLKQLHTTRSEILLGAAIGEDCAFLSLKENEVFVVTTDPITGTKQEIGKFAAHTVANDIACCGAEPVALLVTALLPVDVEEPEIREIMAGLEENCAALNMQIIGGHTEVTRAVNQPVLSVTGIGKADKNKLISSCQAKPGQDIVVSKWIGLEGTGILATEYKEQLLTRYPSHLIEEAKAFERFISIVPEAATAGKSGVTAMHDITEGGIFGALWEIAECAGVGLEIDLKKIPIRQETIEICEFFEINPYEFLSGGSLIMITDDGPELIRALEKENIPATLIGKIRDGNDRVVINDDERRFLEPAKADELYKVVK